MNSNGLSQTNLTDNEAEDREPNFSPNGTKIAFHSDRNGNDDIYTMKSNGSKIRGSPRTRRKIASPHSPLMARRSLS